jgi:hypothetical protein
MSANDRHSGFTTEMAKNRVAAAVSAGRDRSAGRGH